MVKTSKVYLWGHFVAAVAWDASRDLGTIEFVPDFVKTGLDLSPIRMPLEELQRGNLLYSFPGLSRDTFKGLPGLLADSLPDKFGNEVINAWLAREGRDPESFSPVERLCYTGRRGMGALVFEPSNHPDKLNTTVDIDLNSMLELASEVLSQRKSFGTDISTSTTDALNDILRVGTSAGGARAKAIIALNEKTGQIRSGQVEVPDGFEHWLIKFDGVDAAHLSDPKGYCRIEYAYHLMAKAAGITMNECRLLEEGGRAHFMTKRFDRIGNRKLHMQSLCGIAHYDFNQPDSYSYEQAFQILRKMRLPYEDAEQLYLRMLFNAMARNQDDHTKNLAFLMDESGVWSLSPAYDITYAYNPSNKWLFQHQMSINGKRKDISRDDFVQVAKEMNIKSSDSIIDQVRDAINEWPAFADEAGIHSEQVQQIKKTFNLLDF
jgi:serine/threonine-protein kinase HipA